MDVKMDDLLALIGAKEVEIIRLKNANKSLYDRLKQVEAELAEAKGNKTIPFHNSISNGDVQ